MASITTTTPRKRSRTDRIGIVGAGVSGLTAAHYLKRAGYSDVTVLERESRVGGKCCSVAVDGHVYEMGAVLGTRNYTTTRALMRSVGVRGGPFVRGRCFDLDGNQTDLFRPGQLPRILWTFLANYAWPMQVKHRSLRGPGLAGISPQLAEPFEQYAKRHGLPAFQRTIAPPFTGFGYGYFDEVPAAYVMKYVDVPMVEALAVPALCFTWPAGAEDLWTRVAAQHDVRTSITVRRITRTDGVRVQTDQGDLEFDALILTCPLDEALQFLDSSATEQRLLSAIRTYDYWVLLCEVVDAPEMSGYLPPNFTQERAGHVMVWYQPWPDQPFRTLYALGRPGMAEDEVVNRCAEDLGRMGATVERVVATRHWKYFPHVSPADLACGYYDELEALQGTNGTYFAGEAMAFSTVEICARYSKALVRRFFTA